ncbi:hypothetical protein [Azotobacter vinelandii]
MSVYQQFYIKTRYPRQVERLIIDVLGGAGWLEPNDRGEYLRPIHVTVKDQRSVLPARSYHGSPQDLEEPKRPFWTAVTRLWHRSSDTGEAKWYWLSSIIRYQSLEAAQVAWVLYQSPLVELVAEDNTCAADEADSPAWVIDSEHYLGKNEPKAGT